MAKKSEALGVQKGSGWPSTIVKEVLGVKDGKDAAKQTVGLKDKKGDK